MKKITQLIKALSKREAKLFHRYYALGALNGDNMKHKLFKIVIENEELSDTEAAGKLGKKNDASFTMLKRRLEKDIFKFLIVEHDPLKVNSQFVKARLKIRSVLYEVEILWSKGLYAYGDQKLFKAERLAKKYELTQDSILIKEFMTKGVLSRVGVKYYKKFKDSALEDFRMVKEKFEAQDHYRQLITAIHSIASKKLNYIEQAKNSVIQLKDLRAKNNSAEIELWYLKSQSYYNHLINNYSESKRFILAELDFAKSNLHILPRDHIPLAYYKLSIVDIYMENFDKSIEHGNNAMEYFYKESNNHLLINTCLFQANLYKGDYQRAREIINASKKFKIVKPGTFLYYNWLYYEANLNFKLGDFKSTLNILQRNSDLTADKTGWRVGFKILEMMCIIEMQNYDWLDYRIEAFRKLIKSIKTENMARPNLIYEFIKRLIKENYNFKTTTEKLQDKLILLGSQIDEYRWEARGYELIRFDEWWKEKLEGNKLKKMG